MHSLFSLSSPVRFNRLYQQVNSPTSSVSYFGTHSFRLRKHKQNQIMDSHLDPLCFYDFFLHGMHPWLHAFLNLVTLFSLPSVRYHPWWLLCSWGRFLLTFITSPTNSVAPQTGSHTYYLYSVVSTNYRGILFYTSMISLSFLSVTISSDFTLSSYRLLSGCRQSFFNSSSVSSWFSVFSSSFASLLRLRIAILLSTSPSFYCFGQFFLLSLLPAGWQVWLPAIVWMVWFNVLQCVAFSISEMDFRIKWTSSKFSDLELKYWTGSSVSVFHIIPP